MARIHSEVPGIFATKGCAESIQTYFKSKFPTMEDEELDTSTKLGKAKKLMKMKNVMAMAYATQCLSGMAMLNVIFNITVRVCQQCHNLKHKFNPNDKLLKVQMIKFNKINPKKLEDPKVMCNKIEFPKVKYHDQARILNNTIVMHLFLVCEKLYKLDLMQAQVEAEVNNIDIAYKRLIRHMNVAWRIESGIEGVMQAGEGKVVLMNTEFKEKCHTREKYEHKQNRCPKKNKSEEEKGSKKFLGKCNHCSKVGHKAATAENISLIKTRGQRIGRRKKIKK